MMMSFRLGTNDLAKARAFYDATFQAIGGTPSTTPAAAPVAMYKQSGAPVLIVGPAREGEATYANGGTILLIAPDAPAVDAWFEAGMANGGKSEGEPGPRAQVGGRYGAYMRDPDGNKLGCYVGNLFG